VGKTERGGGGPLVPFAPYAMFSFNIIITWLRISLNLSEINCQQWTGQTSKVKVKLDPKVLNTWELGLELHQFYPPEKSNLEQ
jgi:hypothetical protein